MFHLKSINAIKSRLDSENENILTKKEWNVKLFKDSTEEIKIHSSLHLLRKAFPITTREILEVTQSEDCDN